MFAAKLAVPNSATDGPRLPILDQATKDAITLFTAPPGYLLTDRLAAALVGQNRQILWLRIGFEDRDPATLITSLVGAAQRLKPGIGSGAITLLQSNPGPLTGWRPHFDRLAQEFASDLPASGAIVIEHLHLLNLSPSILSMFCTNLLAKLPNDIPRIVISHESLPSTLFPENAIIRNVKDLRVDARSGLTLEENAQTGLSADSVRRVIKLIEGQDVVLSGIFGACATLGPEFIQWAIKRAKNRNQVLTQIVRASLGTVGIEDLQALALAMHLNYSHPKILQAAIGSEIFLTGPWLQPLTDRWARVRSTWNSPLRSVLRVKPDFDYASIHRSADYLAQQGDQESAVRLYLELGDFSSAARIIGQIAERMINSGQWMTLDGWLKQLPPEVLHDWPWLVYTLGELYAGGGHTTQARSTFATASKLFSEQRQQDGACQSLLAESILANWEGHPEQAQQYALSANVLAQATELTWHQGLTSWQLGCLATASGKLDEAILYFAQANNLIKHPAISELLCKVELLAQRRRELQRQRVFHERAFQATKQSEGETLDLLQALINSPPEHLPDLLSALGWSKTPLMFKLTTPASAPEDSDSLQSTGFWQKMLSLLGLLSQPAAAEDGSQNQPLIPNSTPLTVSAGKDSFLKTPQTLQRGDRPSSASLSSFPLTQGLETILKIGGKVSGQPEDSIETRGLLLTVYTLGAFRLSINDINVTKWPGTRGLAVLKYLLVNHRQEIPREVLMDIFWRDSDPDSARNSLNVSLHSLRSELRKFTESPIILYNNGSYLLNPDISTWIDLEEFERHLQAGQRLEATGELAMAIEEYEIAASLYQGDFLEEDLYEEWPVLTRERLRIACLDMLDRLSQIYFSQRQYAACITLSQQILERDNCREDAHRRLMLCYSRQGQQHLALRQYQACVETLRVELEIDPEPVTSQLAERIRYHERV